MYMLVYGLRTDGRGMGGLVEWVDGWVGYVYRNGKVVR